MESKTLKEQLDSLDFSNVRNSSFHKLIESVQILPDIPEINPPKILRAGHINIPNINQPYLEQPRQMPQPQIIIQREEPIRPMRPIGPTGRQRAQAAVSRLLPSQKSTEPLGKRIFGNKTKAWRQSKV